MVVLSDAELAIVDEHRGFGSAGDVSAQLLHGPPKEQYVARAPARVAAPAPGAGRRQSRSEALAILTRRSCVAAGGCTGAS